MIFRNYEFRVIFSAFNFFNIDISINIHFPEATFSKVDYNVALEERMSQNIDLGLSFYFM